MLLFSGGWFLRIYCEYMHYICAHQNTAGAVNDPGVHKHGYFLTWFKFMQGSNCYTALAEQRPNLTRDKGLSMGFHIRKSSKEMTDCLLHPLYHEGLIPDGVHRS